MILSSDLKRSILFVLLFSFMIITLTNPVLSISRARFDDVGTYNFTYLTGVGGNVTLTGKLSGLGLWYKFDNATGFAENSTHIYDYSGNNRNGTITNLSINTTVAKYNNSIKFINGAQGNVTLSKYTIANGKSFTVSFWGYRLGWTLGNWNILIGEKGTTGYIALNSDGTMRFNSGGTSNDCGTSYVFPATTWTMLTITCQDNGGSDVVNFYVNGSYYGTDATSTCAGYVIDNIADAFTNTAYFWDGNLDDIMIWERALTANDIGELYNETLVDYYTYGNYSQFYQTYNGSNVPTEVPVSWREFLSGGSSINVYACVGANYDDCSVQTNGERLNLSANASKVQIVAELIGNDSNLPKLEMLEPPKFSYYVDNESTDCDDTYNILQAMNKSQPLCTIAAGVALLESDAEMIVRTGEYNEGIAPGGVDGTAVYPIMIRGEDINNKPVLNGSLAVQTDGIGLSNHFYLNISNFFIYNFSNDAMNTHNTGEVYFSNMVGYDNGFLRNSAAGDCISFHESTIGGGTNINCSGNYKSTIVDVQGSNTIYKNIYGRTNGQYSVYFGGDTLGSVTNDTGYHRVYNLTIEDSPGCYWSEVRSYAEDIICNNVSRNGIWLRFRNNTIVGFNVSSYASNNSIYIEDVENYTIILQNGLVNNNITSDNSTNVELINITINGNGTYGALTGGNMSVKWYLDVTVNESDGSPVEDVMVLIYDNNSNLVETINTSATGVMPQQNITEKVVNGTATVMFSNYIVSVTKSGYVSQNTSLNMSTNRQLQLTLALESGAVTGGGGGGGSSNSKVYTISEKDLVNGYTKSLIENQKIEFKFEKLTHYVIVKKIFSDKVKIAVLSEPQEATINIEKSRGFDLNGDNYYDLSVTIDEIRPTRDGGITVLTIKKIHEKIQKSPLKKPTKKEVKEEPKTYIDIIEPILAKVRLTPKDVWPLLAGLSVLLFAIGITLDIRKKKKDTKNKKEETSEQVEVETAEEDEEELEEDKENHQWS